MAGGDLVVADQRALLQHGLKPCEPELVIAHREIFGRIAVLARKARHVDVPFPRRRHRQREREGALFPLGMEHRLVRLRLDLAEAVHAAHVLRAVHFMLAFGKPVPIMESRVTSSTSFSSLQPSVPAGRIGITR